MQGEQSRYVGRYIGVPFNLFQVLTGTNTLGITILGKLALRTDRAWSQRRRGSNGSGGKNLCSISTEGISNNFSQNEKRYLTYVGTHHNFFYKL